MQQGYSILSCDYRRKPADKSFPQAFFHVSFKRKLRIFQVQKIILDFSWDVFIIKTTFACADRQLSILSDLCAGE